MSRSRCLIILVAGWVLLAAAGPEARADIAPSPRNGGISLTRRGKEQTKVAMVEETVRLPRTRQRSPEELALLPSRPPL